MRSSIVAFLEASALGARFRAEAAPEALGETRVGFKAPASFSDAERASLKQQLGPHTEYLKVLLSSDHPNAEAVRQEGALR